MKTSSGGVSIGDGATQSTSYADSNSRWNNNDDDNDEVGSRSSSDESEDSDDNYHHSKPPPPREDFFDDDGDDEEEEDDDEYSQIGANPSNNDNNEQIIMQQHVVSSNDSSMFGEDTLHILHHAESRLRTTVPSLPPPSLTMSVPSSLPSITTRRDCIDDSHAVVVAKSTADEAYCNDGMNTDGDDDEDSHNNDEGNDDRTDGSMSEGIASLLRGPLIVLLSTTKDAVIDAHNAG
jgi:hypothetical protein